MNPNFGRRLTAACQAAVAAAGEVQQFDITSRFAAHGDGYKSGEYATGEASDIQVAPTTGESAGTHAVFVFTAANRDGRPYPMFWEKGHENKWTGKEEPPVPYFMDTFESTKQLATEAAAQAFVAATRG
jgi:hypothetical protein